MTDTVNGVTFDEFHKYRIARFPSFANQKDTNFDKFEKWKDSIDWQRIVENNEQRLAKSIDYAHGLELDDIGADYGSERNGLDDNLYRFYLKSHHLSANSKGTFPDLINIISNLLGCDPKYVNISNDRKWKNGKLVGELNTINIDSIDVSKVKTPELIPLLPSELESATLASTKIRQIGFYESIPFTTYTGTGVAIAEKLTLSIPNYQQITRTVKTAMYTGVGIVLSEKLNINTQNKLKQKVNLSSKVYVNNQYEQTKHITI